MITFKRIKRKIYYFCTAKGERREIRRSLTILHPDYYNIPEHRRGKWDGLMRFYDLKEDSFPAGLINICIERLNELEIRFEIVEATSEEQRIKFEFHESLNNPERDYQRKAVELFLDRKFGICIIPTRGGKTKVASELARILNLHPILFIVDSVDLFNQARVEISQHTDEEVGAIREDLFDLKRITIAMIQTLSSIQRDKKRCKYLELLYQNTRFLIIDEIQEYSSAARVKMIEKFSSLDYFLSISATPLKSNNELSNYNILKITGGVFYDISEQELVDRKILTENKILMIILRHDNTPEEWSYSEVVRKLIQDCRERNIIINNMLKISLNLKLKTLVMFNSIYHGTLLQKKSGLRFIHGKTEENIREQVKNEFLKEEGGALLVSEIWKKGITLPEVEILINASGGSESSLILQKRGRTLGAKQNKQRSLTIDFIDDCSSYLAEHSLNRIEAYESKAGKKNIVILDSEDTDFWNKYKVFITKWFNRNV